MDRFVRTVVSAFVAAACLAAGAPVLAHGQAETQSRLLGVWRNPKNTVHVDIKPCGEGICGDIVWASAKAQEDARKGSGKNLIGEELFRDLRQNKDGVWKGKVFVPDINGTFAGSAQSINTNSLRATGCLFAGILCKSQIWTRIEGPA